MSTLVRIDEAACNWKPKPNVFDTIHVDGVGLWLTLGRDMEQAETHLVGSQTINVHLAVPASTRCE